MPDRDTLNLYWSPDSSELFILPNGQGTWVCHPQQPSSVPERFAEDVDNVILFSKDGNYLFFTTANGDFRIWETHPYRWLHRIQLPGYERLLVPTISLKPDHLLIDLGLD